MTQLTPAQKSAATRTGNRELADARRYATAVDASLIAHQPSAAAVTLKWAIVHAHAALRAVRNSDTAAAQAIRTEAAALALAAIRTLAADLLADDQTEIAREVAEQAWSAAERLEPELVEAVLAELNADAPDCDDCGCNPCRCDETFAECDNPEVEHPGHPCNHFTGAPTNADIVAQMKREIADDQASGTVPLTVASFSDLHDHVDANMYADRLVEKRSAAEPYVDWINTVTDQVDRWLRIRGRAAELVAEPEGATLWIGWTGYRKGTRGDWVQIASTPERLTSAELAALGA